MIVATGVGALAAASVLAAACEVSFVALSDWSLVDAFDFFAGSGWLGAAASVACAFAAAAMVAAVASALAAAGCVVLPCGGVPVVGWLFGSVAFES
jgi:hypothetical protein